MRSADDKNVLNNGLEKSRWSISLCKVRRVLTHPTIPTSCSLKRHTLLSSPCTRYPSLFHFLIHLARKSISIIDSSPPLRTARTQSVDGNPPPHLSITITTPTPPHQTHDSSVPRTTIQRARARACACSLGFVILFLLSDDATALDGLEQLRDGVDAAVEEEAGKHHPDEIDEEIVDPKVDKLWPTIAGTPVV